MSFFKKNLFFELIIFIYTIIINSIFKIIEFSIALSFYLTAIVYFFLPIKHNLKIIYKLLYLILDIIEKIHPKGLSIDVDEKCINKNVLIKDNSLCIEKNNNLPIIVKVELTSFADMLVMLKLVYCYDFLVYFVLSNKSFKIERYLIEKFYLLQDQSFSDKKKIKVKIIICKSFLDPYVTKIPLDDSIYFLKKIKKYQSLFYY
jgi:hypothetical protein